MPIAGDATYGSTRAFPRGIALHAKSLEVEHPIARRVAVVVEAPLPPSWGGLAGLIGFVPGDQSALMPTTRSLRVPLGMGTSTTSPTCLPTRAWPIGLVRRILFWS